MTTPPKEHAPDALRKHFEALARDPSFKLRRSRRGTYVNPAVARDWKWFQLGASQVQQPAPAGASDCDTPNYCRSVQRCTAQDEARAQPVPATSSRAVGAQASEIALIEKAVQRVGIRNLLNHGAGSLVWSEGVHGVTQDDLVAYTREIALHCAVALSAAAPTKEPGGA